MMVNPTVGTFWRIGEIMLQRGWITWEQLEQALLLQQRCRARIGEILVQLGAISQSRLLQALLIQTGKALEGLEGLTVEPEALRMVPKKLAYQHQILPIDTANGALVCAVVHPLDLWSRAIVSETTGVKKIDAIYLTPSAMDRALEHYYGGQQKAA